MSFTSFCSAIEKERRRSRKLARLKRVHSRLASRQLLVFHNENSSASPTLMQSAPIAVNQHRISCDSTSRRALFSPSPPSPVTAGVSASTPTTPLLPISEPTVSAENIALSLLGLIDSPVGNRAERWRVIEFLRLAFHSTGSSLNPFRCSLNLRTALTACGTFAGMTTNCPARAGTALPPIVNSASPART